MTHKPFFPINIIYVSKFYGFLGRLLIINNLMYEQEDKKNA